MPRTRIPYHITDRHHSIAYVTPDAADARTQYEEYAADPTVAAINRRYTLPNGPLYVIYTRSTTTDEITEPEYESLPTTDAILTETYLHVFRGVITGHTSGELTGTKALDVTGATEAFNRVQWRQSVPRVAADLFSKLVLRHPLTNANHRTALGFVTLYVSSMGGDLSFANSAHAARVDAAIRTSKQLLTIRRNTTPFRILRDHGCETVVRKGGIELSLPAYRLDDVNPWEYYATQHVMHMETVLRDLLRRSGNASLLEETDDGKRVFAQRLAAQSC